MKKDSFVQCSEGWGGIVDLRTCTIIQQDTDIWQWCGLCIYSQSICSTWAYRFTVQTDILCVCACVWRVLLGLQKRWHSMQSEEVGLLDLTCKLMSITSRMASQKINEDTCWWHFIIMRELASRGAWHQSNMIRITSVSHSFFGLDYKIICYPINLLSFVLDWICSIFQFSHKHLAINKLYLLSNVKTEWKICNSALLVITFLHWETMDAKGYLVHLDKSSVSETLTWIHESPSKFLQLLKPTYNWVTSDQLQVIKMKHCLLFL